MHSILANLHLLLNPSISEFTSMVTLIDQKPIRTNCTFSDAAQIVQNNLLDDAINSSGLISFKKLSKNCAYLILLPANQTTSVEPNLLHKFCFY